METTQNSWLRDQLRERGLTHQDLADALNRVRVQATHIVNGRQQLRLDQLAPTASLLNMSVVDLLRGLGIDPGAPAINTSLLADCLVAVFQRLGLTGVQADEAAHMAATLYTHASTDDRFRAPDAMATGAAMLADYASARRK